MICPPKPITREDLMETSKYKLNADQEIIQAIEVSSVSHILVVKGSYKGRKQVSVMKYVFYSNYEGPKSVVAIPGDDDKMVQAVIDGLQKAIA